MDAKSIDALEVFRKYTRLPNDKHCLVLDVRPQKEFKRHHLLLSYCIRLTSDGRALADYSNNSYDIKWSQVRVHQRRYQ
jgi:rhodanese-related sulfurtransferase